MIDKAMAFIIPQRDVENKEELRKWLCEKSNLHNIPLDEKIDWKWK